MSIVIQYIIILFFLINVSFIETYRILGVFPFNGKSHDVMFSAVMKGLIKRGHQVDHITHFPIENMMSKNYKVVANLRGTLPNIVNNFSVEYARAINSDPIYHISVTYGNDMCKLLAVEDIQKLVRNPPNDPPYDVVITEAFSANCFMGFGNFFKVPIIAMTSSVEFPWITDFIGNNDNLAFTSNSLLQKFDKTKFWDRLNNFISYHRYVYQYHALTEKEQTDAMRKYISPDIPNIRDVERSVAAILINRHPIIYGTKPILSSLIEVSGLHIKENPKLPLELQKWLDESKNGVIYFTFGSLVLFETLPANTIKDIYSSLSRIAPMRVLMKVFDPKKLPPGLPKNVKTLPWIPQQAVLAHKNVKVFITHGGLMGCQEALYYGVPLIGVPLFSDQPRTIATFAQKNLAIGINYENLTSKSLDEAITKVLTEPIYRKSAKFYSKLFRDRPMKPMDTAIFWIEYIIRNGPNSLKSPALELPWWQLMLLDVYAFILITPIIILFLIYLILKLLLKKFIFSRSEKAKLQ